MTTSEAIEVISNAHGRDATEVWAEVSGNWVNFLCLVEMAGMVIMGGTVVKGPGVRLNVCDGTDETTVDIRKKAYNRGYYD